MTPGEIINARATAGARVVELISQLAKIPKQAKEMRAALQRQLDRALAVAVEVESHEREGRCAHLYRRRRLALQVMAALPDWRALNALGRASNGDGREAVAHLVEEIERIVSVPPGQDYAINVITERDGTYVTSNVGACPLCGQKPLGVTIGCENCRRYRVSYENATLRGTSR